MEKPAIESPKHLPSISDLLKESWATLKGSALNLFILYLISIGIFVGLIIVGVITAVPLGVFSIISAVQSGQLNPAFFTSMGALGIIFLILIIVGIFISLALNAAMIMVVGNYKNKPSAGASFKKGFSYALPLFVVSLITGLIIYGGLFLLIIPGLIFALAFSFVFFEIVLNNKSIFQAMRRSMGIVFYHFWGILGRILLLLILIYAVIFIPQLIAGASNDGGLIVTFSLISIIFQIVVGWYGIAYSITLYKHAEAATPAEKTGKLLIPTIVAVVGWIVGIIMIGAIITAITVFLQSFNPAKLPSQTNIDAFYELQTNPDVKRALENPTEENVRALLELLPSGSPERAELERQIDLEFNNANEIIEEEYVMPSPNAN